MVEKRKRGVRGRVLAWMEAALPEAAAGYDLGDKAERTRSVRELERLFFGMVKALRPGLFVEAGAKDAGSSRRAKKLVPHARVVAFEANPYTYQRFRRDNEAPDAGIEYRHLALSDSPGTVTFNVRKTADGKPSADGQGSLNTRGDYKPGYEEVRVEASTLDVFFGGDASDRIVIWVDVEGACREVLRGGRALLSRTSVAFVEVETRPYWGKQQWLDTDVIDFLKSVGLVPVARDFQSRYQYNVLCVRPDVLAQPGVLLRLARHWARTMPLAASSRTAAGAVGRRVLDRVRSTRASGGARSTR